MREGAEDAQTLGDGEVAARRVAWLLAAHTQREGERERDATPTNICSASLR